MVFYFSQREQKPFVLFGIECTRTNNKRSISYGIEIQSVCAFEKSAFQIRFLFLYQHCEWWRRR